LNNRGCDFRSNYSELGVLCAKYSDVPLLAITATANVQDRKCIVESLGLKKCETIIVNPDSKISFSRNCFEKDRILKQLKVF
jgi:superfamily II DNA helicase RecQ